MDTDTLVVIAAHACGGIKKLSVELGVAYNTVLAWKKGATAPGKMAIKCLCAETRGIVHPYDVCSYLDLLDEEEKMIVTSLRSFGFSSTAIAEAYLSVDETIPYAHRVSFMIRKCFGIVADNIFTSPQSMFESSFDCSEAQSSMEELCDFTAGGVRDLPISESDCLDEEEEEDE